MGRLGSFSDALAEDSPELSAVFDPVGERSVPTLTAVPEATQEAQDAAPQPAPEAMPGARRTAAPARRKTEVKKSKPKTPAPNEPCEDSDVLWKKLQRKEFRMHAFQADDLKILTARLNRMGPRDPSERVTDNTLIRLGLALLLEQRRNDLSGSNENELRASLGLPPLSSMGE